MTRKRTHTRRKPSAHPRGVLNVLPVGYGFVQTAEGEFYISSSHMAGAFDGDLVEVAKVSPKQGRGASRGNVARTGDKPAARVVRVIERAHDVVIGRYEVVDPFGIVVPEDSRIPYDIFTMRSDNPDIEDGSMVRVRIVQFPTRNTACVGVVEEVIGLAEDRDIAVDLIIARHKFETEFSEGALSEARAAVLDEDAALSDGYRDIRDRLVLTIDPVDAKDFDDAVSFERRVSAESSADALSSGSNRAWPAGATCRLGVHIADVSHYVPWDSSIDLEARRRATSVYLVDRVIPMIPHELSDDLCSLRPNVTRRCMTADIYLNDDARMVGYELYPALMESKARLTYEQAQDALDYARGVECGDGSSAHACAVHAEGFLIPGLDSALSVEITSRLVSLSNVAKKRSAQRQKAGGLDFATTEAKVRLDEEGRPVAVDVRRKTDATELIEEAMIFANEVVATHLEGLKWPCMYRIHEQPATDALGGLIPVFQEFPWFNEELSLRLAVGDAHAMQEILEKSAERPEGQLVSSLLLRAMKRAVYSHENDGHYGLASEAYAHFTSPIRRYPDLVVHRMLKAQLKKRSERFGAEVAALPWIAEHSSEMERLADTAARESQELKLVEYMQQFVGQTFSAVVSGVASYGMYVRLDNTAEGLVRVRSLGQEYFAFDAVRFSLTGMDTGKVYRLGQRVAVTLIIADTEDSKLEFRLAGTR